MFAIVDIAGFQEKVEQGSKLRVQSLHAAKGDSITFDKVLLIAKTDDDAVIGAPYVAGATVTATVEEHGRGDKIRVLKFKRRKRYTKVQGHRQGYTDIVVKDITV